MGRFRWTYSSMGLTYADGHPQTRQMISQGLFTVRLSPILLGLRVWISLQDSSMAIMQYGNVALQYTVPYPPRLPSTEDDIPLSSRPGTWNCRLATDSRPQSDTLPLDPNQSFTNDVDLPQVYTGFLSTDSCNAPLLAKCLYYDLSLASNLSCQNPL